MVKMLCNVSGGYKNLPQRVFTDGGFSSKVYSELFNNYQ